VIKPKKPDPGGEGLRDHDKTQGDLRNPNGADDELPEGLARERKGPLGPKQGRRQE
jgi:hypothetical protein